MVVKFKWKGEDFGEWDGLDLDEAEKIKAELQDADGRPMLPLAFDAAVFSLDPSAVRMLVSILLTRKHPENPINFEDVKGKLHDFDFEAVVDPGGKGASKPPASSTNGSSTSAKRSRTTPSNSGTTTA